MHHFSLFVFIALLALTSAKLVPVPAPRSWETICAPITGNVVFHDTFDWNGAIVLFDSPYLDIGSRLRANPGTIAAIVVDSTPIAGSIYSQYTFDDLQMHQTVPIFSLGSADDWESWINSTVTLTCDEPNEWLQLFDFARTRVLIVVFVLVPLPTLVYAIVTLVRLWKTRRLVRTTRAVLIIVIVGCLLRSIGSIDPVGFSQISGYEAAALLTFSDNWAILCAMWLIAYMFLESTDARALGTQRSRLRVIIFYVLALVSFAVEPIIIALSYALQVPITVNAFVRVIIATVITLSCAVFYFVTYALVNRNLVKSMKMRAKSPDPSARHRYRGRVLYLLLGIVLVLRGLFSVAYLALGTTPEGFFACIVILFVLSNVTLCLMLAPYYFHSRNVSIDSSSSMRTTATTNTE